MMTWYIGEREVMAARIVEIAWDIRVVVIIGVDSNGVCLMLARLIERADDEGDCCLPELEAMIVSRVIGEVEEVEVVKIAQYNPRQAERRTKLEE